MRTVGLGVRLGVLALTILLRSSDLARADRPVETAPPKVPAIAAEDLQRHVATLASDALEGREAGTIGGYRAGEYIRAQLQSIGIKGGGPGDAFDQPFSGNCRNILGLISVEPEFQHEVVLVCAHYDHVGRGTSENSRGPLGEIHNGADDNASGVALLLELARSLADSQLHHRRSILIAFWDGEEKGMLGSRFWTEHPTLSLDRVKAVVNLDMVGRLRENRCTVYGSRTAHGFRRLLSQHNRQVGLTLDFSWELEDDGDHYPFFANQTPVLFFHTGVHKEFHSPYDDEQTLNYEGMRRIGVLLQAVVLDLADRREDLAFRTQAIAEAEAHREAVELSGKRSRLRGKSEGGQAASAASQSTSTRPLRIGIHWREDEAEPGTIVLTHVVPQSPAAKAGLRVGDRVYRVDGHDFDGTEAIGQVLRMSGVALRMQIERDGRLFDSQIRLPSVIPSLVQQVSQPQRANDTAP